MTRTSRTRSDLLGKAGRQFPATVPLREAPRRGLDSLLSLIDDLDL